MTKLKTDAIKQSRVDDWEHLARLAQGGDKKAYRTLLNQILPFIRIVLSGGLSNQDWVEDITQDVLISVHKSLSTYSSDMPFQPWLRSIIHFRKTDFLRKYYKNRNLKGDVQNNVEIFEQSVTGTQGAGELRDIEEALETLPDKQKEIIEKVKIQGYSIKEVAQEMGMTDSAVKVTVHRALNKLKDKLG